MRKTIIAIVALLAAALLCLQFVVPELVERPRNVNLPHDEYRVSEFAEQLHESLFIADLHSDSLLWKRNLLKRSRIGHMDLPRLREGNVALQVFSSTTKSPQAQNYERNAADSDNIVTTQPTFSMYAHYAVIQGVALREVTLAPGDNFRFDTDAVLAACDDATKLVFVCSPNNPTGTIAPREAIVQLLEALRDRAAVVVDEAYVEFANAESLVDLLDEHDNLVVLRTLSKALAFAGARCGAVIGPDDVVAMLDAVQAPYALATPVVECVEDALDAKWLGEAAEQVSLIVAERSRMYSALGNFDFVDYVWPSEANFLLARFKNIDTVLERTRSDNVLLRHFGAPLVDCVRITIGSRAENDRLLASLSCMAGDNA